MLTQYCVLVQAFDGESPEKRQAIGVATRDVINDDGDAWIDGESVMCLEWFW